MVWIMPEMLPKPKYDIFSSEGAGFRFWPIRAPTPGGGRHESPHFVLMPIRQF